MRDEQQTKNGAAGVILKIINFKKAVAEGDIEKRRETEEELREAFRDAGLDEELIKYLVSHFRRATEIEKAYEGKCKLMQEVRETIRRLAEKV
ncbi:hypothetical protein [Thermocrinis sp.]|uniref:hypothetical protein n=1 Tax=Thermocrinis sp. TaxID=2024383 RepID=UPI003BFC3C5D